MAPPGSSDQAQDGLPLTPDAVAAPPLPDVPHGGLTPDPLLTAGALGLEGASGSSNPTSSTGHTGSGTPLESTDPQGQLALAASGQPTVEVNPTPAALPQPVITGDSPSCVMALKILRQMQDAPPADRPNSRRIIQPTLLVSHLLLLGLVIVLLMRKIPEPTQVDLSGVEARLKAAEKSIQATKEGLGVLDDHVRNNPPTLSDKQLDSVAKAVERPVSTRLEKWDTSLVTFKGAANDWQRAGDELKLVTKDTAEALKNERNEKVTKKLIDDAVGKAASDFVEKTKQFKDEIQQGVAVVLNNKVTGRLDGVEAAVSGLRTATGGLLTRLQVEARPQDIAVVLFHASTIDARPFVPPVQAVVIESGLRERYAGTVRFGVYLANEGGLVREATGRVASLRGLEEAPTVGSSQNAVGGVAGIAVGLLFAPDPKRALNGPKNEEGQLTEKTQLFNPRTDLFDPVTPPGWAAARRCVLVVSDDSDPPPANAPGWVQVGADAIVVARTDTPNAVKVLAWSQFCRDHGGVAVPVTRGYPQAKPDEFRAVLGRLIQPN